MDRLLTLSIAAIGSFAGLFIASGRPADVVAPLTLVLALAAALRLRGCLRRDA